MTPSFAALLLPILLLGATAQAQGTGEPLWPDLAPSRSGDSASFRPTLISFPASGAEANGAAVLICPGGGYDHLAYEKEGINVAKKMNTYGLSAFVVKYRVAPHRHPIPSDDAKRAMRMIRSRAKALKIDTNRIGIMGFSAGGHLASTVATHYDLGLAAGKDSIDKLSCKPAFTILVYPVITLLTPYAHTGSRDNLLGVPAPAPLVELLSNERQVKAETPPAFLMHSRTDGAVRFQNSQMYYDSCLKAKVAAKLLLYATGGHGVGLADGSPGTTNDPVLRGWPDSCVKWLDGQGFLRSAPSALGAVGKAGSPRRAGADRRQGRLLIRDTRREDNGETDCAGRLQRSPRRPAVPTSGKSGISLN
jgi:acetyl esterase/lipase